jgi:hypothetical protein
LCTIFTLLPSQVRVTWLTARRLQRRSGRDSGQGEQKSGVCARQSGGAGWLGLWARGGNRAGCRGMVIDVRQLESEGINAAISRCRRRKSWHSTSRQRPHGPGASAARRAAAHRVARAARFRVLIVDALLHLPQYPAGAAVSRAARARARPRGCASGAGTLAVRLVQPDHVNAVLVLVVRSDLHHRGPQRR